MKHPTPAGALCHPLAITALGLLLFNDHWWKDQFHSAWTGKLSDVVGLVLFPLVLQALWETAAFCLRAQWRPSRAVLAVAGIATAGCFTAVQISPWAGELYVGLSTAVQAVGWGFLGVGPVTAHLTPDPTDLWTLPALLLPFWIHHQRVASLYQGSPLPEEIGIAKYAPAFCRE